MSIETLALYYRGKQIQAYRCGRGSDVILFLNGSGVLGSLSSFGEVMNRLSKKTCVYAIDLPGYGASEAADDLEEGIYPYFHRCLEAIVEQLKLERFVLVGLSMGGAVAIRYALEHPEQVCGLVPVSSWGLSEKSPSHYYNSWIIQKSGWVRKFFRKIGTSPSMAKWYCQSILFGRKSSVTSEIVDEVMAQFQKDAVLDGEERFLRNSVTSKGIIPAFGEELSRLKMPVLLIHGKRDPLIPRSQVEKASRIMGNSRLHIMLSCRHWCCKEQPELFYQALWAFVKRDCLFSYKNMLPKSAPTTVEKGEVLPQNSPEVVENQLHVQVKNRWEKRRRAATKAKLLGQNKRKAKRRK